MAGLDLSLNQTPNRAASQMANPFPGVQQAPMPEPAPQDVALQGALGQQMPQPRVGTMPVGGPVGMAAPQAPDPHAPHMAKPGYGAVRNAYQTALGRDGDPNDIMGHVGDGSWSSVQYALSNILGSPEAKLYAQQQRAQKQQGAPAPGGAGGPMMGNGMPNPGFAGSPMGTGGIAAAPSAQAQGNLSPATAPSMPPGGIGTPPGSPSPQFTGNTRDPQYIEGMIKQWGQTPGVNPSVQNDPGYWEKQILSKPDGLSPANADYWKGLAMTPEGGRPSPAPQRSALSSVMNPMLSLALANPTIAQGGPDQAGTVIQQLLKRLALGNATGQSPVQGQSNV